MSQIVRWDAKKGEGFVQALDLQLDKETTERVGRVYGIIAADTKGRKGEAMAAHLEDAFTRGATEAVRKLPGDAPQDQLFEAAIARVNHALARLFGEYGLDVEPERVTAAILAIKEHDVVAATWGKPSILLFHPIPNARARTFDLVDDSRSETQAQFKTANVRRCFGSIIAGRMGKRDRLLVSSHDLRAFVGDDRLEATVVSNEPAAAATVINQLLSPVSEGFAVAALMLDVTEVRYVESDPSLAPAARAAMESATNASIAKMLKTQTETVETMKPSLIGDLGKKVTGIFGREAQPAPTPAPAVPEAPVAAMTPEPHKESVAALTVVAGARAAGKGAVAAAKGTWSFLVTVSNKEKRTESIRGMREGADNAINGLIDRFNGLKTFGRTVAFAALSLVIAGRGALLVNAWNGIQEEKIASYERAVASVQQKIDSAEASMIYRDEGRAKELLVEAAAATELLPEKKPEELQTKDELRTKIAGAKDALRRQVALPQPEIVASISSGGETPSLEKLAPADGVMWSVSSKGEIFKVSLADGATEKVADAPGGVKPDVFLTQGRDLYAAAANGSGTLVTPAGKTSARNVDFGAAESTVADAGIYNARLYVLDAAHNRIMRHAAGSGGYGKAQFYLKDGTDLSQGVSLAIDGAVYVLRKDGSIVRIVQGVQETFGVAAADPPVTAPLRLRTEGDGDLFVLDSQPARILRYSKKTGALLAQYVSDSLNGATDFTVDAKGKTALVSVNNQILRFALPEAK